MGDLWLREMGDAEPALDRRAPATRLRIMVDAVDYVMFRSLTPLSFVMTTQSSFLVESALDVMRTGAPPARLAELEDKIGARVDDEASVASNMLVTALNLLAGRSGDPRSSDACDVLFCCYDATVLRQGFGRVVTLEHQLSSRPCLDVIRQQMALLDIP